MKIAALIKIYMAYLTVECRYSRATVGAYYNDLMQFERFVQDRSLSTALIDLFFRTRYPHVKAATLIRKQSVIRQFIMFLFAEGHVDFQYPSDHHAKSIQRLPIPLSVGHISQLLVAPCERTDQFFLRDRLLLQWLYGYGLRVSEVVSATQDSACKTFIRVFGKGNKVRRIARHMSERQLCHQYCDQLRSKLVRNKHHSYLFVSNRGESISRFGIYMIIQKYAKRCGLDHVHPHRFRHSFATHLLESGATLAAVQSLMGHASIQTTQGYTRVSDRRKRQVFNQSHPRS